MSNPRSMARRLALQALYQWQVSGQTAADISAQFAEDQNLKGAERGYYEELLAQVPVHADELDAHLQPMLDRPLHEVDPVERAILRIGAYELAYRKEIPYRVVLNEAIELAKVFGGEQGHKYVNSILDGVAKTVRPEEVAAKRK
jgi:N utilization substance protein B